MIPSLHRGDRGPLALARATEKSLAPQRAPRVQAGDEEGPLRAPRSGPQGAAAGGPAGLSRGLVLGVCVDARDTAFSSAGRHVSEQRLMSSLLRVHTGSLPPLSLVHTHARTHCVCHGCMSVSMQVGTNKTQR